MINGFDRPELQLLLDALAVHDECESFSLDDITDLFSSEFKTSGNNQRARDKLRSMCQDYGEEMIAKVGPGKAVRFCVYLADIRPAYILSRYSRRIIAAIYINGVEVKHKRS
ncbi:hypothetical protein M7I_5435 [Glarea lozoyensis 74030]|uniref:Uncharacterized protein n=1 Tax=Glarea lozoyensis (strain ATCC 74030 / MF5533) TaxID=1104152 RepID=H0ERW3_GLAL7|nr:hypothetical protein M7I_5435 [Glarea lozoyensis 74030]